MNQFELGLQKYLSPRQLRRIQKVKVGIAGAGGLGSNCAALLVRTGFKRLVLVDFDRVEVTNLNRQFYFLEQVGEAKVVALKQNLLQINPDLEITVHQQKISAANINNFFNDCPVVVEAFDQAELKQLLVEYFINSAKLVVTVSGLAGWADPDLIVTRQLRPNLVLIGDGASEVSPTNPPLAPRVNLAAAKQANAVLAWVLQQE